MEEFAKYKQQEKAGQEGVSNPGNSRMVCHSFFKHDKDEKNDKQQK